jgi:putative tryptophan/tyrosine transport system substrate-binding protein
MQRRKFITLLGGAVAWPIAARAQQPGRMRRIGVLLGLAADDSVGEARFGAFLEALQQAGWSEGRNIEIVRRFTEGDAARARQQAEELVALAPDLILTSGASTLAVVVQVTHTVPVVFVGAADPVGAGFVDGLAHPGTNATGFTSYEYSMSGKWLELLKEIAPEVKRVAVLRDPSVSAGTGQLAAIQTVAPSFGVELTPINVRDPGEIERALTTFVQADSRGMIVTASAAVLAHRALIITLAARHTLPAVYYARFYVTAGGLTSYGPDYNDLYRRAAGYVDRILKGEKPADLPVQAPTKYELAINLKTAKALGLTVPPTLLARADEVIEWVGYLLQRKGPDLPRNRLGAMSALQLLSGGKRTHCGHVATAEFDPTRTSAQAAVVRAGPFSAKREPLRFRTIQADRKDFPPLLWHAEHAVDRPRGLVARKQAILGTEIGPRHEVARVCHVPGLKIPEAFLLRADEVIE